MYVLSNGLRGSDCDLIRKTLFRSVLELSAYRHSTLPSDPDSKSDENRTAGLSTLWYPAFLV